MMTLASCLAVKHRFSPLPKGKAGGKDGAGQAGSQVLCQVG